MVSGPILAENKDCPVELEVGRIAASWGVVAGSAETAGEGIGYQVGKGRVVGCLLDCQVQ